MGENNMVMFLEDLLGKTEEGWKCTQLIDIYVRNILFSGYHLRREIAQKELNKLWGSEVKLYRKIVNENIFAYIQFKKIPNKFIVVGIYPMNFPVIEEEIDYWGEFLNPN